MLFNTFSYLAFLLLVVVAFWVAPARARTGFPLVASIVFYALWRIEFVFLITFSAFVHSVSLPILHVAHVHYSFSYFFVFFFFFYCSGAPRVLYLSVRGSRRRCIGAGAESHVRLRRGAPLGRINTFVPLDIAARVERLSDKGVPMFELLRRAGVQVGEAEQWIGATLASVESAKALAIEVGAPVLKLVRVVFDTRGRAVERVVAEYRAEAYVYRMRLAPSAVRRPSQPKAH